MSSLFANVFEIVVGKIEMPDLEDRYTHVVPAEVDPSPPQGMGEIPYPAVGSITGGKAVFLLRVCSHFSKYSYM